MSKRRQTIANKIIMDYCNKTWAYLVYSNPNVVDQTGIEILFTGKKTLKIEITLDVTYGINLTP